MTDEQGKTPATQPNPQTEQDNDLPQGTPETPQTEADSAPPAAEQPAPSDEFDFDERLERLGGEPAPVITPEEFARLQRAGQVHIDSGGRVRAARRNDAEGGVSLRKRRAWYAAGSR